MVQYRKGRGKPWTVQHRIRVVGQDGKVTSKVETAYFPTKALALEFEKEFQSEQVSRKHGISNPHEQVLFLDFVRGWLKRQRAREDYALSSWVQDEGRIRNYWLSYLGPHPLKSITTNDILERLDYLQIEKNQSPASRNRHRALLHVLFEDALVRGKVKFNPVSAIPLVPEVRKKKQTNFTDEKQFETFLSALHEEGREYWLIGMIMGYAGFRICTANVLQYQDVDLLRGIVIARRIEERAGGSKVVERIKGTDQISYDSEAHVVPLLPRLLEVIEGHRAVTQFSRPTDFIAANPKNGNYIPYDTLKDVFKRATAKAEIPEITSHAIRRHFATELKRHGFSRAEIREMGGWSSEQVVGLYDLKDVSHLIEKAKLLGFGASTTNVVQIKKGAH